ncbi:hypothetical protein [Desulfosporosinus sp. OT]|nr:hypothetical protein [Desulfosporosinus sp. OT]EGW38533.1 hypothetical protein DOT_3596 [Desulfosporosinus sp. OT]
MINELPVGVEVTSTGIFLRRKNNSDIEKYFVHHPISTIFEQDML